jgi:hypothetical protein
MTIKETKLECIRDIRKRNKQHVMPPMDKDFISGKKTPKRKGDLWVPSSSKGGLLNPQRLRSSYN